MARNQGHAPAKLYLRCHHAVMRQRRMLHAGLRVPRGRHLATPSSQRSRQDTASNTTLIVSRESRLSRQAKYATLSRSRRRAQIAARRALDLTS